MHWRMNLLAAAVVGLLAGGAAAAHEAHPPCTQWDANLPPSLSAWNQRSNIVSAAGAAELENAELVPGKAVTATLHPVGEVAYVTAPEKRSGAGAHGGLFRVRIAAPGNYRFALNAGAWIDVLKDGRPVVSSAHGRGAVCTTIQKMVEFPLERGDYVLQVSGNADPTLAILIVQNR
jgi:hypothetical protein